jgi:hypothetical protein
LKQKEKKVDMKSKLVKLWREKESPFHMYKELRKED